MNAKTLSLMAANPKEIVVAKLDAKIVLMNIFDQRFDVFVIIHKLPHEQKRTAPEFF